MFQFYENYYYLIRQSVYKILCFHFLLKSITLSFINPKLLPVFFFFIIDENYII